MSKYKIESRTSLRLKVLFLASLFLLGGCEKIGSKPLDIYATKPTEPLVYTAYQNPVVESQLTEYLVPNNLIVEQVTITEGKRTLWYPIVTGMKSESVQEKINTRILAHLDELDYSLDPKTIVPYRGIRTKVKETDASLAQISNIYPTFNCNNILSIQIYGWAEFADAAGNPENASLVSVQRGLTIDLNTGDLVPLNDLFVDGYDYESVINDALLEYINQNGFTEEVSDYPHYGWNRLIAPFAGIKKDQTYYLDEYSLNILFDEGNEYFEAQFNPTLISVPLGKFGDNLAIDRRYLRSDENLYTDETQKRILNAWKTQNEYTSQESSGTFEGGTWYLYINGFVNRASDATNQIIEEILKKLNGFKMTGSNNYVSANMFQQVFSEITTVGVSYMIGNNSNNYVEEYFYVYDAQGNALKLEDLFVDGFEYEALIREEMKINWVDTGMFTEDEIYKTIDQKQFTIARESITIVMPSPNKAIVNENLRLNILFDRIGIENLEMFQ